LNDAVAALPEPYCTVVTLRFFDQLPPRAIAKRLGVSSEVVRQRLHRGLEMLRARMDREFGERADWQRAVVAVASTAATGVGAAVSGIVMKKFVLLAAGAALLAGAFYVFSPLAPATLVGVSDAAPAIVGAATSPLATGAAIARAVPVVERLALATADSRCWIRVVDARANRSSPRHAALG
jgi:hypothetical protein